MYENDRYDPDRLVKELLELSSRVLVDASNGIPCSRKEHDFADKLQWLTPHLTQDTFSSLRCKNWGKPFHLSRSEFRTQLATILMIPSPRLERAGLHIELCECVDDPLCCGWRVTEQTTCFGQEELQTLRALSLRALDRTLWSKFTLAKHYQVPTNLPFSEWPTFFADRFSDLGYSLPQIYLLVDEVVKRGTPLRGIFHQALREGLDLIVARREKKKNP